MQEKIDDVDGALWGITKIDDGNFDLETTVYRFLEKKTPINEDLNSYKFHVFVFKPAEPESSVDFLKAYIGDVKGFIDNYARAGYNGVLVKDGCMPKKTIKDIIKVTSKNWDISDRFIKPILAQV